MMSEAEARSIFLLDVNLLLALAVPQHVHHSRARSWFAPVRSWASCAITENGLLRLMTRAAVMIDPVPMPIALRALATMRSTGSHQFLADDASLTDSTISLERLTSSRDVTDIHLVDLAARHGAVLATLDRGIPELLNAADRRHVLVIP